MKQTPPVREQTDLLGPLVEELRRAGGVPAVKKYLEDCGKVLGDMHAGGKGLSVCRRYSRFMDDLLGALFEVKSEEAGRTGPWALIATGGYGRAELNLRSDIDLLLLHRGKITPALEDLTQSVLYILWDTGLDIGFTIRTVGECVALARDDLKTKTSLIDTRLLAGEMTLHEELSSAFRKSVTGGRRKKSFIDEKLAEMEARHGRFGGSVYLLEPNVKEGEGGLRDLHTARWIVQTEIERGGEPLEAGFLSEEEREVVAGSFDFLLWVRNELHIETSRKYDQLTFDHQERIAPLLGFRDSAHTLAVESFMQTYYRQASNINRLSNLMISRFLYRNKKRGITPWRKKKIEGNFYASDGMLTFDGTSIPDTLAAVRAFEHCQARSLSLDQHTKDLILDFLKAKKFSVTPEVARAFLKILGGPRPYEILSEMHRLGLLEAIIPEFSALNCRVQHDLYHVYTVDAHTLFAVRELERLGGEDYTKEFPVLASLYRELPHRAVAVLGVLLHDIGKPLGKGHAVKGAELVPGVCKRLGLDEDSTELVTFLVANHLILADTAQYRDIHDDKLIVDFARRVGDTERLGLLYLLTFADVRAVGPEVWNQWKGALFQELYFKALKVLERGEFEIEAAEPRVKRIRKKVLELLTAEGVDRRRIEALFELLPQRYFLTNSPERISDHFRAVLDFESGLPLKMSVRQDEERNYTELIICTYDITGLFSMIAGVMTANGIDILGAQINTLTNGTALDILQVVTARGTMLKDDLKLKKIERDLVRVITGEVAVTKLVGVRKPSILEKKEKPKVPTRVQIDNTVSETCTVIEVLTRNRIGLLYDITSKLTELGLYIHLAKISTKGDEAADVFYVRDIFGQKIYFRERLEEIRKILSDFLTERAQRNR